MSGYLEVKYPFKSNLGLNPFKSWKRQWCILRPSVTPASGGGSLAVYCSEAGAAAGSVPLPNGGSVRRTKSRSRPHAFAVFPADDRKPCVLLAAHTHHEAQAWMEKIRALIKGDNLDTGLIKDSFSVTIIPTELSRKCGLTTDGTASVAPTGLLITKAQKVRMVVEWKHLAGVTVDTSDSKNSTCVVTVDSGFREGGGSLQLSTPLARDLCAALTRAPRRARSHTDLTTGSDHEETNHSSWSSEPSEVSLDDLELLTKRCPVWESTEMQDCTRHATTAFDKSMTDRRSMLSIASGIYEEIAEPDGLYCTMGGPKAPLSGPKVPLSGSSYPPERAVEPTYESVAECVYATVRRRRQPPPPLPPRVPFGAMKPGCWSSGENEVSLSGVTRHSSLGSLHSLPERGQSKRQPFSVFRKRLKSDSRIITSPKADTAKENKDTNVENKKKKFDFPPTKDLFKNFKVSRKMKNLKITGNLAKAETKSCEYLDETEHVTTNRNSKSVECLENDFFDEFDCDLSIDFNDDAVAALALPQEIIDIIRGRSGSEVNRICIKKPLEGEYLPMSPIVPIAPLSPPPAPVEHHYTVMSPHTNVA